MSIEKQDHEKLVKHAQRRDVVQLFDNKGRPGPIVNKSRLEEHRSKGYTTTGQKHNKGMRRGTK